MITKNGERQFLFPGQIPYTLLQHGMLPVNITHTPKNDFIDTLKATPHITRLAQYVDVSGR